MTVPKPPSKIWAHGHPPKDDPLDRELEKLKLSRSNMIQAKENGQLRAQRIPLDIKVRLQEKFPQKPNAQIGWVLRQMEALKDTFLDGADSPKNLHIAPLIQYRATLVSIRDTIHLRDHGPAKRGRQVQSKNPLKGMLTNEQITEIAKAKRAKNGATDDTEEET